jgi:signal transduction histidine kinase
MPVNATRLQSLRAGPTKGGRPFLSILPALLPALLLAVLLCPLAHAATTLRVGAYPNYPKVFRSAEGEVRGIFPDLLDHIARQEGWKIEYSYDSWENCLDKLRKGSLDLMPDVAISPQRSAEYALSSETVLVNWGVVYAAAGVSVESMPDLAGKLVAVMKGSIHTEGQGGIVSLLDQFNVKCEFVYVDSYADVFRLLHEKAADAGVVNRIFGTVNEPNYTLQRTPIVFNPVQVVFAMRKGAPLAKTVLPALDARLHELKQQAGSVYYRTMDRYLNPLGAAVEDTKDASGGLKLTPEEEAWLAGHHDIRIGVDPEFYPFEFLDAQGQYSGIASDYVRLLNQRLGISMQVVPGLSWKEATTQAKEQKIDILPCVGKTPDRATYLNFSEPYIQFHRVIITRDDFSFISGIEDIRTAKVGVQANTSHEGFLRNRLANPPVPFNTQQDLLLAVSDGRVDAVVVNVSSATYWIRKLNLTNLKVAAPTSSQPETLHFAVRRDWPQLVAILNKALAGIPEHERIAIRERWLPTVMSESFDTRKLVRYILYTAGAFSIVILIIMVRNKELNREIQRRLAIEERLQHYTEELESANEKLTQLDQLKSMFIASMSHELRTPLNSIIGFTGILLQGLSGELGDKQRDHLNRVYGSAKHLLSLITDIIDIAKIEAGRIDVYLETFPLTEVIAEAVDNIKTHLEKKGLGLHLAVPDITVHTDRKRLLQCVINYLSNAVKYTEQGEIRVIAREEGGQVEILVRDTGVGIRREDMPRLFEAFERMESKLKIKAGGTGLGLYLTKKLATDILRGSVSVESRPGVGSVFRLNIPKDFPAEPPAEPQEAASA